MKHFAVRPALFFLLSGLIASVARAGPEPDPNQVWPAGEGRMMLEVRGDYLTDFGIEVRHQGRLIDGREGLQFPVREVEPLRVRAPWGHFRALERGAGRLAVASDLAFRRHGREIRIDTLALVPADRAGHPVFLAVDDRGRDLFTLSHVHVTLDPRGGRFSAANAEVEAGADLARALDFEALSGMPIGMARLDLAMSVPADAELEGTPPGCSERPIWPQEGQYEADVTLIGMDNVAYQGTQSATGRIKIAPSATLKNESLADVPWIGQFDSLGIYPYTPEDQHPYLVWNLYRIADGRIEMLAGSGAKHAFFTINVNCDSCGSNNVLWAQCEDVYSASSNDTSTYQGPRDEIEASLGTWESCKSFFDPDCDASQEGYSGQWQHRLLVDPGELQDADAEYFLDAWYVIQYDVDIWNSMGFRPIEPTPSGNGWLMNPGPFSQGPVISQWVSESESDPLADHDIIVVPSETPGLAYPDNVPQGHLRLLARVSEVAPGRYRYRYALQNYDFDRGLEGFRIGLTPDATVFDSHFGDVDSDAGNDWSVTIDSDSAHFDAPADNPLTWFTLFNFEIETDALPVTSTVTLSLGSNAVQPSIDVTTIGPAGAIDLIFGDRFAQ